MTDRNGICGDWQSGMAEERRRGRDDNGGIIIWRQMASSVPLLLPLLLHTHPDPSSWKISLLLQWFCFIQVILTKCFTPIHLRHEPFYYAMCQKKLPLPTNSWNEYVQLLHVWVLNPWHWHGRNEATYNELLGRETSLQSTGPEIITSHGLREIG